MYYDRRVDEELAETLKPGGPLAWLMTHVQSGSGRQHHAHLQFRRARSGGRRRGSVQLYWGRTSPLEIQLREGGRVRLVANRTYQAGSEHLFADAVDLHRLSALRPDLLAHLDRADILLGDVNPRRSALRKGEATCHAGLMRRYGHSWQSGDEFVAVDSEARVGFDSRRAQETADEVLAADLGLRPGEALPKKLDTLAVLPSGDLALIEVKDERGDIGRAVTQVAAHVARFSRLMAQGALRAVVQSMLDQKRAVGLVPEGGPDLGATPRVVPIVAAPHDDDEWARDWSRDTVALRARLAPYLGGLRWLRLSAGGDVLEDETP